ncbi:MAG: sigma-70 family RNA polymerase sigma factor [Ruminococcaceae bacterium]|nr:sigma-70 family RNA polymerase sigma factor [Oscillospiraceae bacterium]
MNNFTNTKERIKLARDGDEAVLSKLLEENTPLVKSIAKRFVDRGVDFDDLMQIGMIGLIKAIRGFDFSYDTVLSTYAVPMIYGEIKRFLRDDGIIKVSRETKRNATQIRRFEEEYEQKHGVSPNVSEVSSALGISEEDVVFALSSSQPVSPLTLEGEDGNDFELPVGVDDSDDIVERFALLEAIEKLSREERELIKLRYFKNLTQQQTAKIMGMSQVKVSRFEKRICIKLKSLLE